jgi:putative spermidine/putrescine transport system ATP-binding protein
VTPVLVEFRDVAKSYDGGTFVVTEFNLTVRQGEFLTLLGPSGSGKTTCLMMLAGFEGVSSGEIFLDGRPLSGVPPHKRGIGMVFQNYALFPHMTVAENLAFPLQARGVRKPEIRERIQKALAMVRLEGLGQRRPQKLSGGQQQRVAVARALVFEPELVLMDEPLGALDKQLREEMQYEIKRIHETLGVTVLYVTHDQNEALTMSSRIAVMQKGRVQQIAGPRELYESPANLFVAQFVGENNCVAGTTIRSEGRYRSVRVADGSVVRAVVLGRDITTDVTLWLRPERIEISPSRSVENHFEAVASDVIFRGDHLRIQVRLFGQEIIVKVPNATQTSRVERGEKVKVGWGADDCWVLEQASGPGASASLSSAAEEVE